MGYTYRLVQDALLTQTKALPAAAGTVNGTAIDTHATDPGAIGGHSNFQLSVPATPSLANSATLTFTVQDSADNSSFAAVSGLATLVMTGAGGVGSAAASQTWRLPPNLRRYVRVSVVESAAGGDNSAVSMTYKLLV